MENKITEKDLLQLSGKLAIACEIVLNSNVYNLSNNLKEMQQCLINYNNLILEHTKQKRALYVCNPVGDKIVLQKLIESESRGD